MAQLRDPDSATFRNVRRVPLKDAKPDAASPFVYCGEVNSKNGFGGYAGYVEFAVLGKTAEIRDPDLPLNVAYKAFCESDGMPLPGTSIDFPFRANTGAVAPIEP